MNKIDIPLRLPQQIAHTTWSDRMLQVCAFPALPHHLASSLVLSARACFLHSATRLVFSFVLWRATCNVLDLLGTPLLPSTRFHYALSQPEDLWRKRSCTRWTMHWTRRSIEDVIETSVGTEWSTRKIQDVAGGSLEDK